MLSHNLHHIRNTTKTRTKKNCALLISLLLFITYLLLTLNILWTAHITSLQQKLYVFSKIIFETKQEQQQNISNDFIYVIATRVFIWYSLIKISDLATSHVVFPYSFNSQYYHILMKTILIYICKVIYLRSQSTCLSLFSPLLYFYPNFIHSILLSTTTSFYF